MEGLTDRQAKFLDDYAFDERTMRALLVDHEITPAELRRWKQEAAFCEALAEVDEFLAFVRTSDLRKGACGYLRRVVMGLNGDERLLGVRYAREGRGLLREASRLDPGFLTKKVARKCAVVVVNPVHPAFMSEGARLMERLAALQKRALEVRAEMKKQLPPPVREGLPAIATPVRRD